MRSTRATGRASGGRKFESSFVVLPSYRRDSIAGGYSGERIDAGGTAVAQVELSRVGQFQTMAMNPVRERFELPFTFNSRFSVLQAVAVTFAAFFRIVLGCGLFSVWRKYTFFTWTNIENLLFRFAALLSVFATFLLVLALVMLAISAWTRVFMVSRTPSSVIVDTTAASDGKTAPLTTKTG